MANRKINNIQLGLFVLSGLLFLILGLYFIGKNENLFGANFRIKARFSNVSGLVPGNNVLYSGIQVGTVKKVKLINDTLIEVVMVISEKTRKHIRKNAIASVGTEGLIGNKIINLLPGPGETPSVEEDDILASKVVISTDDMLETLAVSNRNLAEITEELKTSIHRINNSTALWNLLNEEAIPSSLKNAALQLQFTTGKANEFVTDLQTIIRDVKEGKGSLGAVLTDTLLASQLSSALEKINRTGENADRLTAELNRLTQSINRDINEGKGTVHALLKDTAMVQKLNLTLHNIEKGTAAFNDNMEALKHTIFLRGYFRKLDKQKAEEAKRNQVFSNSSNFR